MDINLWAIPITKEEETSAGFAIGNNMAAGCDQMNLLYICIFETWIENFKTKIPRKFNGKSERIKQ